MSPNLARLVSIWSSATGSQSIHTNYRHYVWALTHGASEQHDVHAAIHRVPRGSWGSPHSRRLRRGVEVRFCPTGGTTINRLGADRSGWVPLHGASPALAGGE